MNEVTWAIQTNLLNDQVLREVWQAALDTGANVQEIVIMPFMDEFYNAADIPELSGVIIPYGSTNMIKKAKELGWLGNCYVDETFRADTWNANRTDMLNQDMTVLRVKDTPIFFKDISDDEDWFIRPIKDLKEFTGTVTNVGEIKKWMQSTESGNFSFNEDTEIVVAPAKKIHSESRFFIVAGKMVSGSYYRIDGRLRAKRILDQDLLDKVQKMADIWLPHECCVMDVADTDDGMKCIEYNTINGSGIYANSIPEIVNAMTEWGRNLKL